MNFARCLLLSASLLALTSCDNSSPQAAWSQFKFWVLEHISSTQSDAVSIYLPQEFIKPEQTVTGSYLASRFAQNNGDWSSAEKFVNDILDENPDNTDFQRKAMILAMGSGRYSDAMNAAKNLVAAHDQGSLAYILLTLQSFKTGDADKTLTLLRSIPQDGIGEFITPLMAGWTNALNKNVNVNGLNRNPVHLYHAILIADFLNDRATIITLAQNDFTILGLAPDLLKHLEDIFVKYDLKSDARKIHEKLVGYDAANSPEVLTALPITSAQSGLAQALYDMGSMLYTGYGDSARLFAHMALYLNPAHIDARILLAQMASDAERGDEAISIYQKIDTSGKPILAIRIQRQIADLLEKSDKIDAAVRVLKKIVAETKDIPTQIQIADIYRRHDDFSNALQEYNIAASMIGNPIPKQYWELLYARGMTYERLKKWDKAEADLQAALTFQPDHPYILNYLGYSWADQGLNLPKAAAMIERAAQLQPTDAYIIDSLGWVYYRMKDYTRAVIHLERAIELMSFDPTINDHLGDAYWQTGRRNEARFQWKRALSFKPDEEQRKAIIDKIENGLPSPNALITAPAPDVTAAND